MLRAPSYLPTEDTLHVPISVEELDLYLSAGGRPFSRHRRMRHLLWRVRVTLESQTQDLRGMRRAVDQLSVQRSRVGTPTTLNPVDALKFASPEEISQIVDRLSQKQLKELKRLVDEWTANRNAMVSDLARVRSAATIMMNRTDFPAAVRTEFARLLNEVPTDVPDLPIPHVLQMQAALEAQLPAAPRHSGELTAAPRPAPASPAPVTPGPVPVAGAFNTPNGWAPPASANDPHRRNPQS